MTVAVDLEVLDATVFVGCAVDDPELVAAVAGISEILTEDDLASGAGTDISAVTNEDADPDRAAQRPGGFLFFPAVLEVYAGLRAPRRQRARVMGLLLAALWSRGIPAVAACEYDDLLPWGAGTTDRGLPWPAEAAAN